MTNQFAAIGSALYGRLGTVQYTYTTNGTATAMGTLGAYDTLAPQGVGYPYVIFQYQAGLDEYNFAADHGEMADYLVKVVSNRSYASAQAFGIYDTVHTNLQFAPLSVSGDTLLRIQRRSRIQYRDTDGFWHVGGIYRVDTWAT